MPKSQAFQQYSQKYDDWFLQNELTYASEVQAVKGFIPEGLKGVEIGVGTGRFALPLGISVGVEPADSMAELARVKGIEVKKGTAECLPLADDTFDYTLMVTAICFFDDVGKSFREAHRVLKSNGFLIVAMIDRESKLGQFYQTHKQDDEFYRNATFYSVPEVEALLTQAGFSGFSHQQTVFSTENISHAVKEGYGVGGFVVIKAMKQGV